MEEYENKENTVVEEAKPKKVCHCAKIYRILFFVVFLNTIISLILVVLTSFIIFKISTQQQFAINNPMHPEVAFQNEGIQKGLPIPGQMQQMKREMTQDKHLFEKGLFGNNFKSYNDAKNSDKKMFVLFYADWCPHCQRFSPTFEKLSKEKDLKKSFNFVTLNSESSDTRALMEEYQVQGFPALFIVDNATGKKTFIPNNLLFEENAIQNLKDIAVGIK